MNLKNFSKVGVRQYIIINIILLFLIQACSKSIRCDDYHDNQKLLEEIGDVQCMIDLIKEYGLVSSDEVNSRIGVKKLKLKKWSKLYNG